MSYANHPMFQPGIEPANNIAAAQSGWTCSSSTTGLTFNPKTALPSLATGDIVIVQLVGQTKLSDSALFKWTPPSGWNALGGRCGEPGDLNYELLGNSFLFWKVYESSDNTDLTFTASRTDTYCYNVARLQDVSKRCPFPVVVSSTIGPAADSDPNHTGILVPPVAAANAYGHTMVWIPAPLPYHASALDTFAYDMDPATSGAYQGSATAPTLILDSYKYQGTTGNGNMNGLWVWKNVPLDEHTNVLANTYPAQHYGNFTYIPTLATTTSYLEWSGSSMSGSSVWTIDTPILIQDPSVQQHYLGWNFSATAGDTINVYGRAYTKYVEASGPPPYNGIVVMVLYDTDNSTPIGSVTFNDYNSSTMIQSGTVQFGANAANPDAIFGYSRNHTNTNLDRPHMGHAGFSATALNTGTHYLRVYHALYTDTDFSWSHSTGSNLVNWAFDYLAVGINQWPSWTSNGVTAQTTPSFSCSLYDVTSEEMSHPMAFLHGLESNWTNDGTATGWQTGAAGRTGMLTVSLGGPEVTFPMPYLSGADGNEGLCGKQPALTPFLSFRAGTDVPPPNWGNNGEYTRWNVSRPIYPTYYATEEATSATAGKYYWEVTAQVTSTQPSQVYYGFGTPLQSHHGELRGGGLAYRADGYIFSLYDGTQLASGKSVLSINKVLGFAVDYENDMVYCYVNGVLQYSCTLSSIGQTCNDYTAIVWGETQSTDMYFKMNLTGAFTYTKPTGFVAYDWTNEVT